MLFINITLIVDENNVDSTQNSTVTQLFRMQLLATVNACF